MSRKLLLSCTLTLLSGIAGRPYPAVSLYRQRRQSPGLDNGTTRAYIDGQDAQNLIGIVIEGDLAIRQLNALQDYVEIITQSGTVESAKKKNKTMGAVKVPMGVVNQSLRFLKYS